MENSSRKKHCPVNPKKLERQRKRTGLTQYKLAKEVGISGKGYEKILKTGSTSTETMLKLADFFDVAPESLTSLDDDWSGCSQGSTFRVSEKESCGIPSEFNPSSTVSESNRKIDFFRSMENRRSIPATLASAEGFIQKLIADRVFREFRNILGSEDAPLANMRNLESRRVYIDKGLLVCMSDYLDEQGNLKLVFRPEFYDGACASNQASSGPMFPGKISSITVAIELPRDFGNKSGVGRHGLASVLLDVGKSVAITAYEEMLIEVEERYTLTNQKFDDLHDAFNTHLKNMGVNKPTVLFAWHKDWGGRNIGSRDAVSSSRQVFHGRTMGSSVSSIEMLASYYGTFLEPHQLFPLEGSIKVIDLGVAKYSNIPFQLAEAMQWGSYECSGQIIAECGPIVYEAWFEKKTAEEGQKKLHGCDRKTKDIANSVAKKLQEIFREEHSLHKSDSQTC